MPTCLTTELLIGGLVDDAGVARAMMTAALADRVGAVAGDHFDSHAALAEHLIDAADRAVPVTFGAYEVPNGQLANLVAFCEGRLDYYASTDQDASTYRHIDGEWRLYETAAGIDAGPTISLATLRDWQTHGQVSGKVDEWVRAFGDMPPFVLSPTARAALDNIAGARE